MTGLVEAMGSDLITGIVSKGHSLLFIGPPGVGKSTALRDMARTLSLEPHSRRVVVVDTSNELGGEGRSPHRKALGDARRLQVPDAALQHEVMVEAVTNHTPNVVVIDELGSRGEAEARRMIGRRGVSLLASVHGNCLEDLVQNTDVNAVVGGVKTVIFGDRMVEMGEKKVRQMMQFQPVFNVVVEIVSHFHWRVHHNVKHSVELILEEQSEKVTWEDRQLTINGTDCSLKREMKRN